MVLRKKRKKAWKTYTLPEFIGSETIQTCIPRKTPAGLSFVDGSEGGWWVVWPRQSSFDPWPVEVCVWKGHRGDRQWESVLVLITASRAFTLTVNTLAWASVCCCSACVLCDPDGVTMASWPMGLFAYSGTCSVHGDLGKDWRANSQVYMCIAWLILCRLQVQIFCVRPSWEKKLWYVFGRWWSQA